MNANESARNIHAPLERIVDAAAKPCVRWVPQGVTPNQITWLNLAVGLAGGVCILFSNFSLHWLWAAALLIVLHAFLDSLDGALARQRQLTSPCGKMIDHLFDALAFLAYAVGLALSPIATVSLALVIAILVAFHDFLLMMWLALAGRWHTGVFGATELQFAFAILCIASWFFPTPVLSWHDAPFHLFDLAVIILGSFSVLDFFLSSRQLYMHLKDTE